MLGQESFILNGEMPSEEIHQSRTALLMPGVEGCPLEGIGFGFQGGSFFLRGPEPDQSLRTAPVWLASQDWMTDSGPAATTSPPPGPPSGPRSTM